MTSGDDAALAVGDLVRLVGMADESMNGLTGELVKPVGKDRWVVAPSGGDGKGDKTKVVSRKCLVKLDAQQQKPGGLPVQPCMYSIAGTWDEWEVHEMRWNAELQCFEYPVTIGSDGKESFKLLLEGDWDACLHPDRHDANPHDTHVLQGPDDGGLDEEWTIGHHQKDQATPGDCYKVRLLMGANGVEKAVSWAREQAAPPPAAAAPAPRAARVLAQAAAEAEDEEWSRADGPKYGAVRPTVPWREAVSRVEAADAGEAIERAEREARKRLERRLAAAAEAELLPIEDARGHTAQTVGALTSDWEMLLRRRKIKDARSRYDESFKSEEAPAERSAAESTVDQPQEGSHPSTQMLKKCVDCGSPTPYQRCSACLLLRVHNKSWKPQGVKGSGRGGPQQPQPAPTNPREAFDQYWTFSQ